MISEPTAAHDKPMNMTNKISWIWKTSKDPRLIINFSSKQCWINYVDLQVFIVWIFKYQINEINRIPYMNNFKKYINEQYNRLTQ
jgi:hypothetical protein